MNDRELYYIFNNVKYANIGTSYYSNTYIAFYECTSCIFACFFCLFKTYTLEDLTKLAGKHEKERT